MKTTAPPDAGHCPLCGKPNRCAMEVQRSSSQKQPPCWCTQANFSADLLARIPVESKGLACVCPDCAKATASC